MRLPWVVRVLWQPDVELDLVDNKGEPDHGKIMGFYLFTIMMFLTIFERLPSLGHTIAILATGFGWVGYRTFLKSKILSKSEEE